LRNEKNGANNNDLESKFKLCGDIYLERDRPYRHANQAGGAGPQGL
jgi:hypothetical protein